MLTPSMDAAYAQSRRLASAAYSRGGERVEVDGVWAEYMPRGALVFDTEHGGKVVGAFGFDNEWSLDPEYQGRGLAVRIDEEWCSMFGKSPEQHLKESMSTMTPQAERLTLRVHALAVQRAVNRGLVVTQRVVDSVASAEKRFAALRRGDVSALGQLTGLRRRRTSRPTGRYHWIAVSGGHLDWLRGAGNTRRYEKMVVVVNV